jgi:hypothetical protein
LRSSIPDDAAAAYEALRPSLLNSADQSGTSLGAAVLLRQGMLAWASASRPVPAASLSSTSAGRSPVPSEISKELVQVMAGLILHYGKESLHA